MLLKKISFCTLMIFMLWSCDKKEEEIPSFLNIQEFSLEENINAPFNVGSLSHKITNAEVFVSDVNHPTQTSDYLGFISIPGKIPYLGSGEKIIRLDPVIKGNGSSFFLRRYPFYKSATIEVNLTEFEETTVNPISAYKDSDFFEVLFNEGFEGSENLFSDFRSGDATMMVNTSEDAFEGNQSAKIVLTPDQPVIEVGTSLTYSTSLAGNPFLELNFKTDIEVIIGVIGLNGIEEQALFEFGINPSDNWNKIYFELREQVSFLASSGFDNYKIAFAAFLPRVSGEFINETRTIQMDNFKFLAIKQQ